MHETRFLRVYARTPAHYLLSMDLLDTRPLRYASIGCAVCIAARLGFGWR